MAVRTGSPAPYGPPAGVLDMIMGFRERGLTTPFSSEVYARAGISESLIPRVKNSMEALDLVDADGNPTPTLIALRQVRSDEFQANLADAIKAAYSEVFQFVDPAKDDATRIADAFRSYEPHGQRARMITLFMGLCEAAGIAKSADAKVSQRTARPAISKTRARAATQPRGSSGTGAPSMNGAAAVPGPLHPAVAGLLASIPTNGRSWTREERERFMSTFGAVLDFAVPIGQPSDPSEEDDS